MKIPEIETARLRLRRYTLDDLDAVSAMFRDPDVMRYLGTGEAITKEASKPHLINLIERYWEEHRFGRWALIHKDRGELIGHCGFRMLKEKAELVYLLAKPYWGMGLATEAAKACLRYAFEELQLEQIIAATRGENVASRRVLERIGMTLEDDLGLYDVDCVYYSISRNCYHPGNSHYVLEFNTA
jgi:RimJ/RimL family protein N-acetyltransferase